MAAALARHGPMRQSHPAGPDAPAPAGFDEATMLRAMTALHGARKTPPELRPALVTHLLNEGVVAYTDFGWTITAMGYRRLAAAEGTPRGAAFARSLVDQTARERSSASSGVRDVEDTSLLIAHEGAA